VFIFGLKKRKPSCITACCGLCFVCMHCFHLGSSATTALRLEKYLAPNSLNLPSAKWHKVIWFTNSRLWYHKVVIFVAVFSDHHQQLPQISLPGGDVHHLVSTVSLPIVHY